MPYLIDGHNLIGALTDIRLGDENAEAKLVLKLRGFTARARTKCAVIFDGGLPAGASQLSTSAVKVVFAPAGSSADSLIRRRINQTRDARNWTLVSSDREIVERARRQGMRQISSAEFAGRLNQGAGSGRAMADGEKPSPSADDTALWLRHFGDAEEGDVK